MSQGSRDEQRCNGKLDLTSTEKFDLEQLVQIPTELQSPTAQPHSQKTFKRASELDVPRASRIEIRELHYSQSTPLLSGRHQFLRPPRHTWRAYGSGMIGTRRLGAGSRLMGLSVLIFLGTTACRGACVVVEMIKLNHSRRPSFGLAPWPWCETSKMVFQALGVSSGPTETSGSGLGTAGRPANRHPATAVVG